MKACPWGLVLALVCLSGCHFCQDELNAVLMVVPGAGFLLAWLKARFHHRRRHNDCGKKR